MKIYILGEKTRNTFMEEIHIFSEYEFEYIQLNHFEPNYGDLVLIQWPESIFDWIEPTRGNINKLKQKLEKWSEQCVFIYQVNNLEPHNNNPDNYRRLYNLFKHYSTVFLHYGRFSLDHFKVIYSDKEHLLLPHPLYNNTYKPISRSQARKILNISENCTVMIAPGSIRKKKEKKLVFRAFKCLNTSNKILVCTHLKKKSLKDFKGRILLKKIIDVKKVYEYLFNEFSLFSDKRIIHLSDKNYSSISSEKFAILMSASDIVFIPRTNVLNSGILYMGLTFNKIVVGPKTGNISEILSKLNFPVFNPNKSFEIKEAMQKALKILNLNTQINHYDKLDGHKPENVAKSYDTLFNMIKNTSFRE